MPRGLNFRTHPQPEFQRTPLPEFDDSVGRLHGRVVNSGAYPIATFEATDIEGIRREFHRSIDEYLKSCEEDGIEPY